MSRESEKMRLEILLEKIELLEKAKDRVKVMEKNLDDAKYISISQFLRF